MAQRVLDLVLKFRSDKASVDQTVRDNQKIEKSLESIRQEVMRTRESYERLDEISRLTAAAGAAVLAPLVLSANKYSQAVGTAEETNRKWLASTKQLSQNQVDLGRKATAALQPYLDLAVKVSDQLADLPPGVINAAVALGGSLVLVGSIGSLAAQIGKLTTSIQLLAANQQLKNVAIGGAALAGGTFLGVKAVQQIGKATDDKRLEEFTGASYRVQAKTFTVRDSLNCSNEQDAIVAQYEGRELLQYSNYPVLKFGTAIAEFTVDGKDWQPIPLDELDHYLDLPEFVAFGWVQAIFERNPQRYDWYESIKKSIAALGLSTNTPPTSENTNGVTETPPAYAN